MHPGNAKRTRGVSETALTAEINPYQKLKASYYAELQSQHEMVNEDGSYIFSAREVQDDLKTVFHGTNTLEVIDTIREEAIEKHGYGDIDKVYSRF